MTTDVKKITPPTKRGTLTEMGSLTKHATSTRGIYSTRAVIFNFSILVKSVLV